MHIKILRVQGMHHALQKGVCFCVCMTVFAQWQVTTGTVSSRAIKAQGTLRQRKDKQHRHPGMFCGQPNKNKSLYAHGRISITLQRRVAIIMLRGHQPHRYQDCTSKTQNPTSTKCTHPLVSVYPTEFTWLHTRHGWNFWSCSGFTKEKAVILMLSSLQFSFIDNTDISDVQLVC